MHLYLDESGDLGFDLNRKGASAYLVLTVLVCENSEANSFIVKAVKRTLMHKISSNIHELKGNHTSFTVKKYFLNKLQLNPDWRLYTTIANKKIWLQHHQAQFKHPINKKILYDEIASRLITQIDLKPCISHLQIVVDRSKNRNEIIPFDEKIIAALSEKLPASARLSIRHRSSQEDPGLQAVDLFCWGIRRKYEHAEMEWYQEFSDKIAVEVEYKF